jgi:deoxycytidylate deaminase
MQIAINNNIVQTMCNILNNYNTKTVAAVLLRSGKQVGRIHLSLLERTSCHGRISSGVHAEINALVSFYGKNISYNAKLGWVLQKGIKTCKKVGYDDSTYRYHWKYGLC